MAAQLRPTRLDVTDRFPMLGFTIRASNPPRVAEVVLATSPALFASKDGRNPSNFYTSREHGLLTVAKGEAVYVVPPDVLGRFVAADRLYFGLATATPPKGDDWIVELRPAEDSPYVSLTGLSDRALRRVRMFPARRGSGRYAAGSPPAMLDWAGDRAEPGMTPTAPQAPAAAPGNGAAAPAGPPASVPYDDGFGPLPPLASEPPASTPAAQSYARGLEADPDQMGIEEPVLDEQAAPQAMAFGGNAPVLTAAEYAGVTKLMPSPNYNEGRGGQAIDRIVIHITGAPQSPHHRHLVHATRRRKVSAHYMVDQNGEIIQFVREQDIAWHAKGANRSQHRHRACRDPARRRDLRQEDLPLHAADRRRIPHLGGPGRASLRQIRPDPGPDDDHRPSRGRHQDHPQRLPRRRLGVGRLYGAGRDRTCGAGRRSRPPPPAAPPAPGRASAMRAASRPIPTRWASRSRCWTSRPRPRRWRSAPGRGR